MSIGNFSSTQPKGSRRKIIIIVVLSLIVLFVFIIAAITSKNESGQKQATAGSCLNRNDYKDLTGRNNSELRSTESFYSYAIEFQGKSLSYVAASPSPQEIIKNIGSFYQSHKNKSVVVTIAGINAKTTDQNTATQRLEKVNNELVAAGVSDQAIKVEKSVLTNEEPGTNDIVTVAITTGTECK